MLNVYLQKTSLYDQLLISFFIFLCVVRELLLYEKIRYHINMLLLITSCQSCEVIEHEWMPSGQLRVENSAALKLEQGNEKKERIIKVHTPNFSLLLNTRIRNTEGQSTV